MATWVLYDELLDYERHKDPRVARLSRQLAAAYEFPVSYLLLSSSGRIVDQLNANADLLSLQPGAEAEAKVRAQTRAFLVFLEQGLRL